MIPGADCPTPGKRAYRHHRDARRALKHIQSIKGGCPVKNIYRCSCGCYHLTSQRVTWTPKAAVA